MSVLVVATANVQETLGAAAAHRTLETVLERIRAMVEAGVVRRVRQTLLSTKLAHGALAHVHVNWLSPTKIRQMVIGGTRRTLVWDDLNPQQRLSVHDRGVDLTQQSVDAVDRTATTVSYRLGDTWAPALPETEALAGMVAEFAASIRERRAPLTDGEAALRVVSVLAAAGRSLAAGGATVDAGLRPAVPRQDRSETLAVAR